MRKILFTLLLGGLLSAGIVCAATPTEAPIPTKVAKSVAVASPVPAQYACPKIAAADNARSRPHYQSYSRHQADQNELARIRRASISVVAS